MHPAPRLLFPLLSLLLLWPGLARGGDPDIIFHYGKDFVLQPAPTGAPMVPIAEGYRHLVYLNFDGATLRRGPSNSREDQTELITAATHAYPAFGWAKVGGRDKGLPLIVDELKLMFMKVAVELVTTRPASGDYTMVMVGGFGEGTAGDGSAVGIAPLDCKQSNKNDVVLVFGDKIGSAKEIAFVIAHEVGHSFGLEHVEDRKSIMFPALNGETCCWTSSAVEAPGSCGRTSQDDERVLLENVGAGPGDTTAPLVWFSRPGEGAVLPQNFSIEVGAVDDLRIHHVVLFLDGVKKLEVPAGPYAAFFSNLPDGEHLLRAEAVDWKPNTVSSEIKITVDSSCAAAGTCTAGKGCFNSACQQSEQCSSGFCAIKEGSGRCAMSCEGQGLLCPTGTSCEQTDGQWLCTDGAGWTLAQSQEGGCTVASSPALSPGLWLLLGLLLIARRRSRRPR